MVLVKHGRFLPYDLMHQPPSFPKRMATWKNEESMLIIPSKIVLICLVELEWL